MDEKTKQIAQLYKSIAQTASVSDAFFSSQIPDSSREATPLTVTVQFSQRDVVLKKKIVQSQQFFLGKNSKTFQSCGFPTEMNDFAALSLSPTRQKIALIKYLDPVDKTKASLQVWSRHELVHNIPTSIGKHGAVYTDELMGGLSWSPNEKFIAYVAERKLPENESYFQPPQNDASEKIPRGKEFEFQSDWGEQYSGKKKSEIFVVDLEKSRIHKIENLVPENIMPGQLLWASHHALIFTGWAIPEGMKPGFVYCFNRESRLYQISPLNSLLDPETATPSSTQAAPCLECVSGADFRCRSPRISPDGKFLAYLSTQTVLTHNTCSKLMLLSLDSGEISCLVDVVQSCLNDDFPGLYLDALKSRCWSSCGKYIFLDSIWRSNLTILRIHINTRKIEKIHPLDRKISGSSSFLDQAGPLLLYAHSSPTQPPTVFCHNLREQKSTPVVAVQLGAGSPVGFSWEICSVTPSACCNLPRKSASPAPVAENAAHTYETIVLLAGNSPKPTPFVVIPHGGPHGSSVASFNPNLYFLLSLGYSVILVNYRGSLGFGLDPLESLLGQCGSQDVNDVQFAVQQMISRYPRNFDPHRAFLMGGSHGGFLTLHLIAQFPPFYRAAVAHNPVTDFVSALRTSDIPDWVYAESLACSYQNVPSAGDLAAMFARSPLALVESISTPLLLKIGQLDARVHPSQGLAFYRALIGLGRVCKVYLYPNDCHPIDSVHSESDSFVNIALWFSQYDEASS